MRITFVCASLDLSGGARIIANYARMLSEHGHQVSVVAPLPRPPRLRRRVRSLLTTGRWNPNPSTRSHFDGLKLDIRRPRQAPVRESDVPDADVVIATWWETAEWALPFSQRKGCKVYLVQGHEVFDFLPVQRSRATYHMPFKKIVVSGWLQRIMEAEYGDRSSTLVPNAIDHGFFTAPVRNKQPQPTVGFMYGPGTIKGSDIALEAVRRLRALMPGLRVVSFGTQAPADARAFEGIEYRQLPTPEQLRDAYASCDVWLCPSRTEGFGLPAMEAMGCRTPVVATPIGWPQDGIRDGWNGHLVPVGDAEATCQAALKVLTLGADDWMAMSEHAQQTARSHTWEQSYALFEAALQSAVAGCERVPLVPEAST
jgi:glycosyltransferase involved in cell wall biosynthesis